MTMISMKSLIPLKVFLAIPLAFLLQFKCSEANENKNMLTIAEEAFNLMYIGLQNPVTINYSCFSSELTEVRITNGELKEREEKGKFFALIPKGTRQTSIEVYKLQDDGSKEKVDKKEYRVRNVPKPQGMIAGVSEGEVRLNRAINFNSVSVSHEAGFAYDLSYEITGFTFKYIPKHGRTFEKDHSGKVLTEKMKEKFQNAETGDRFLISNIKAERDDYGTITEVDVNEIDIVIK